MVGGGLLPDLFVGLVDGSLGFDEDLIVVAQVEG